jgi:MFS superfamily sulfate permease-like transporter
MDITIIGWVWLGIVVGILIGITIVSIMANRKQTELESENLHLIFVRDSLKEEIFRLENQSKPKPRKRRNIRAKSIKVGK